MMTREEAEDLPRTEKNVTPGLDSIDGGGK
jgi:hypothetical protein